MAATSLIKFTQGSTVGEDGQALLGVVGTAVHVSNVDNANVLSWQLDLVYVDPRSHIAAVTPYAYADNNNTPAANFTPDSPGSYRVVLKVWDLPGRYGDPTSTDIRVFSVAEANGYIVPPSQLWPLPLPDPRTGDATAKPNEMNFEGQQHGWSGLGSDGLLSSLIRNQLQVDGEHTYAYPPIETTSDAVDQILLSLPFASYPVGVVVRVIASVTVYNKNTDTDFGFFEHVGLFSYKMVGSVPTVSLVQEGESVQVDGSSVGIGSKHSVRFSAVGGSALLLCTPSSSTADLHNSWKVITRILVHKAS